MLLICLFLLGFFAKDTSASDNMTNFCQLPSFVSNALPPNVLIILDNAQSMDENVYDTALGSYDPNSKAVLAKNALLSLVNQYSAQMNIGIATYSLPGISYYYLSASPYFVSYQPKSYCGPIPTNDITTVPACVNYCETGNAAALTACNTACQAYNPLFDGTYMDENIQLPPNAGIGGYPIGSALRNNYCSLNYPKTEAWPNPDDPANFIYTAHNSAMYSSWNPGAAWFCFAPGYVWNNELVVGQFGDFNYNCWSSFTGQSDSYTLGNPGYFGWQWYQGPFGPTDSDQANGYGNFGRIVDSWYIGPTWFANSSPGGGYLKVPIAASTPAQITALETALSTTGNNPPNDPDCAGTTAPAACNFYMSCANTANPNACSYVINAGLSPTPGTFLTALDYFKGTLNQGGAIASPISDHCRKNYVVFVTDGMPDTNESGNPGTSASLMPDVLSKISSLRCPTLNMADPTCLFTYAVNGTTYPFDIQTYALGVGLSPFDQNTLDQLAIAGGTAQDNLANPGHAFYVNDPTEFLSALTDIFAAIARNVESGTAASVLSSGAGSGSNLLQASFYPERLFGNTQIAWTGGLQNLWYYLDPGFAQSSIREDTVHDYMLNLQQDYITQFYYDNLTQLTMAARYDDVNGNGSLLISENTPTLPFDQLQNIFDSGTLLWQRNLSTSPRTIYTTIDGATLMNFSLSSAATLTTYLNVSDVPTAQNTINYITGTDILPATTYRSRTVSMGTTTNVWKLGDILNSTPKIASWVPLNNEYWTLYGDSTYQAYTNTASYASRGAVYAGANDGMFHAFKLGTLQLQWSGQGQFDEARLINPDTGQVCSPTDANPCGNELWAFIPKNVLPYLKYNYNPNYCHVYTVDLAPFLFDASTNKPASCTQANYWDCPKDSTSWRTIVIGGMRTGGACRDATATCTSVDGSGNPDCVQTPVTGQGYSSYFALDVTDQDNPVLLWEFSSSQLGFATSGPAIVRINSTEPNGVSNPGNNGRWLVVFGSGPTGPINTASNQFMGYSDQDLRFFILDLPTGQLLNTIDTGIPYAFAGSMYNSTHDTGYANPQLMYQDSVIYVPYTMRTANAPYTWTNGGVGRIVTGLNLDPTTWTWSNVIDGLGPITSSVQHLDDPSNGNMWLFFGEGRYFYAQNSNVDDPDSTGSASGQRHLFGIKEPCAQLVQASPSDYFIINPALAGACQTGVSASSLTDVTNSIPNCSITNASGFPGWYIDLNTAGTYSFNGQTFNYGAERVITDPVASSNGLVFYTTFMPYVNECTVGGQTQIWAANYCNGGPGGTLLQGEVLAEVSTGAIAQINLKDAMTGADGRSTAITTPGAPPTGQGMALFLVPPPAKRVLQIRER